MPLTQDLTVPATIATRDAATLVTTATSQPALRTGFAVLGLVSLLDMSMADHERGTDRLLAVGGAAAAGWFLVRGRHGARRRR